jgi:hypothetical protein
MIKKIVVKNSKFILITFFIKSIHMWLAMWCLDTGHFFNTSLIQGLVFKGIVKGQESKIWASFKGLRSFRGPQKQNWKNDQNSIIFWAKNKMRRNFIWENLMEFLLFNEVLKSFIFFKSPIKKVALIMLI